MPKDEATYPFVWHWKKRLPERKGTRCRILSAGKNNTLTIEFEADGHRVVASRYAVRRAEPLAPDTGPA